MGPNITYMHEMLKNISIVYGNEDVTEKACDMKETTHFPEVWCWFLLDIIHHQIKLKISVLHIQHSSGPNILCSLPNDDQCSQGCLPDSSQLSLFSHCPLSVLEHVWQSGFFAPDTWWVTINNSHIYAKMNFEPIRKFLFSLCLAVFPSCESCSHFVRGELKWINSHLELYFKRKNIRSQINILTCSYWISLTGTVPTSTWRHVSWSLLL